MKSAPRRSHLRVVTSGEQEEGLIRVCEDIAGNRGPERWLDGVWQPCDWPEEPYLDLEVTQ